MKLSVSQIDKLLALSRGESLPASGLNGELFRAMREDGALVAVSHGSRKSLRAADVSFLRHYVAEHCGIADLEASRDLLSQDVRSRGKLVAATGDSKFAACRTCKGFLVNAYHPVHASLRGQPFVVAPLEGSFLFVSDYEQFTLPEETVVVGVENVENFRQIACQRSLFEACLPGRDSLLFVCRYPQNGDLVRWLRAIPNSYVHFGDLDLAGVHIYLSEFYRHLGLRASFLLPPDYERRLQHGSVQRYNDQYARFGRMAIADSRVQPLVDAIHRHHKGYDQEGYIETVVRRWE